jgi:hypothetical protein
VQTLEEELRMKEKKLRELQAQEQQVAGREKRLDNELASRRGEFDYTGNVLDGYAKGFLNRVQPAEVQLYEEEVEARREDAANEDDLAKEMETRLQALMLGAKRLQVVAGGQRFEGRGLIGSDCTNSDFAVAGPVGYFAAKGKLASGLTGIASNGVPQIALFEGPEAQGMRKLIEILNFTIPTRKTVNGVLDSLLENDQDEALVKAKRVKGLSGNMVVAGVESFYGKRRILEDSLLEKTERHPTAP